jgi:hypothetical protein
MGLITALAISIGVLGGIAAGVSLQWGAAFGFQIWVAFIAWATFYTAGGKESGLTRAIVHNVFGAILGWIALLLITQIPLGNSIGTPAWAGICVAVTVFVLVIAATNAIVKDIPASVVGYAAVAGLFISGGKSAVTAVTLENPLIIGVISLIIGAILGYISEKIAVGMAKP